MNEEFLAYVWGYRLLTSPLQTVSGEPVVVLSPGNRNPDSGPDFFNARIRIGPTLWAGNVEIHVKASDWYRHGHHTDASYANTILHAVWEDDLSRTEREIQGLPVLVMQGLYDETLYRHYQNFMSCRAWIPCAGQIRDADPVVTLQWLTGKAIERLEKKTLQLRQSLEANQYNLEQTFYEFTARAFGARVNADAFQRLARSLPLQIIANERKDLFALEALLFGQSGMLSGKAPDAYHQQLKTAYKNLKKKYHLQALPAGTFRFLRLRPLNFPTIRIAQFATLLHAASGLFSRVLQCRRTEELLALFNCGCSGYWENHYRFGKTSARRQKNLGGESVNLILVNTVVPFLFVYGNDKNLPEIRERAIGFLERLPPEENTIVKNFRTAGLAVSNALGSQALLEIKSRYCDAKKCLECAIGHHLFTGK